MTKTSPRIQIELLSFGNELLIGEIVNTNSAWIAKELTQQGVIVTRMITASDDLKELEQVFRESFERKPKIIITTGGLGPTFDDLTLQGLAKAVEDEFKTNSEALELIKKKYAEFKIDMSKAAEKMAFFPINGKALQNPVGTAPGCYYYYEDKIHVFALPGVPKEMKAMFEKHIKPFIDERYTESMFFEQKFDVANLYESKLAAVTTKLAKEYPGVYIKSHPNGSIKMHVTAYGDEKTEKLLEEVVKKLKEEIEKIGGKIKS
jgi:molybdenum cofactor synthesis domain-containing protein